MTVQRVPNAATHPHLEIWATSSIAKFQRIHDPKTIGMYTYQATEAFIEVSTDILTYCVEVCVNHDVSRCCTSIRYIMMIGQGYQTERYYTPALFKFRF